MCGCGCSKTAETNAAAVPVGTNIVRVEDMSCGHCVATITRAIQAKWPSAQVKADLLVGKTVTVLGVDGDADLRGVIQEAGYTPLG